MLSWISFYQGACADDSFISGVIQLGGGEVAMVSELFALGPVSGGKLQWAQSRVDRNGLDIKRGSKPYKPAKNIGLSIIKIRMGLKRSYDLFGRLMSSKIGAHWYKHPVPSARIGRQMRAKGSPQGNAETRARGQKRHETIRIHGWPVMGSSNDRIYGTGLEF